MTTFLSDTTLQWRGATFYGRRGPDRRYVLSILDGWEDLPGSRREEHDRPQEHGTMGAAPLAGARVVRTGGMCRTPAERDAQLAELGALFAYADPEAPPEALTITHAGRTLTAFVYVTRYQAPMDMWGAGKFRWRAELVADDPLRYGPPVSAGADFPLQAGGLRFPLYSDGSGTNVGSLDFGATPTSGRLTLTNTGVARAAIQHEITGPTPPEGFEIRGVATGGRLVYEGEVPAGTTLLLDGATGLVLLDGVTDRGDLLTYRDWPTAAPGESVELAFLPLGSRTAGHLTSSLRPPVW